MSFQNPSTDDPDEIQIDMEYESESEMSYSGSGDEKVPMKTIPTSLIGENISLETSVLKSEMK